jgi:hypothetical protein
MRSLTILFPGSSAGCRAAGPVCDECLRRSEPKTAAAAGDQVNPAVQSKIHPAISPIRIALH